MKNHPLLLAVRRFAATLLSLTMLVLCLTALVACASGDSGGPAPDAAWATASDVGGIAALPDPGVDGVVAVDGPAFVEIANVGDVHAACVLFVDSAGEPTDTIHLSPGESWGARDATGQILAVCDEPGGDQLRWWRWEIRPADELAVLDDGRRHGIDEDGMRLTFEPTDPSADAVSPPRWLPVRERLRLFGQDGNPPLLS